MLPVHDPQIQKGQNSYKQLGRKVNKNIKKTFLDFKKYHNLCFTFCATIFLLILLIFAILFLLPKFFTNDPRLTKEQQPEEPILEQEPNEHVQVQENKVEQKSEKSDIKNNEKDVHPIAVQEKESEVRIQDEVQFEEVNLERRKKIKNAFEYAWSGYVKHAFGHDEVRPCTNETNNSWGGLAATLVDGLDTAVIMNVNKSIIDQATEFISKLNFQKDVKVSVFETTIRYLGSLLSLHDLTGNKMFLQKAKDLADKLLKGFDSPLGLAYHECNLGTGVCAYRLEILYLLLTHINSSWTGGNAILSEIGSVQLEFVHLSDSLQDPK